MRRIFSLIIFCLIASGTVSALDLLKKKESVPFDYTAWSDSVSVPEAGVLLPVSVDGVAVFADTVTLQPSGDNAFAAALCFVAENLDRAHDRIDGIDFDNRSFQVTQSTVRGSNSTETTYTRTTLFAIGDGSMEYSISDAAIRYREKGLIPRTLPLEKLNPASNSRHRELVFEMADANTHYIESMRSFINSNAGMRFEHPDLMKGGRVVEGMSPLEVKVLLGVPPQIRNSGERERWVYSNDLIVIFTHGKVTKVIE